MAYFDGTESGRLISLLTNDLDLMMSPIQSSLSSLLNNILILIGGIQFLAEPKIHSVLKKKSYVDLRNKKSEKKSST